MYAQAECKEASTATQSGEMKGKVSPPFSTPLLPLRGWNPRMTTLARATPAPIHLVNAGSCPFCQRRWRVYCCAVRQNERHCAASAPHSDEMKGDASPRSLFNRKKKHNDKLSSTKGGASAPTLLHTAPAPTRLRTLAHAFHHTSCKLGRCQFVKGSQNYCFLFLVFIE